MKKKYTMHECQMMKPTKLYELIISGIVKKYPSNYFAEWNDGEEKLRIIGRYLFEEKLKLNDEEIVNIISKKFISKHQLISAYRNVCESSLYKFLNIIYPNKFKVWDLNKYPEKITKDIAKDVMIEFLSDYSNEELYQLDTKELLKICPVDVIKPFNESLTAALLYAFPERNLLIWKFKRVPNYFYDNDDTVRECLNYIMKEELNCTEKEFLEIINIPLLKHYGLSYLIKKRFNGSIYNIIEFMFPGKYTRNDIKSYHKNG